MNIKTLIIAGAMLMAGVGCASRLKGGCQGGDQTICSFRFGQETIAGRTSLIHEIDVPAAAKATYEIIGCSDSLGCDPQNPVMVLDCTGTACRETSGVPSSVPELAILALTDGKTIHSALPNFALGSGEFYKVRVSGGSLVIGSRMQ